MCINDSKDFLMSMSTHPHDLLIQHHDLDADDATAADGPISPGQGGQTTHANHVQVAS